MGDTAGQWRALMNVYMADTAGDSLDPSPQSDDNAAFFLTESDERVLLQQKMEQEVDLDGTSHFVELRFLIF